MVFYDLRKHIRQGTRDVSMDSRSPVADRKYLPMSQLCMKTLTTCKSLTRRRAQILRFETS